MWKNLGSQKTSEKISNRKSFTLKQKKSKDDNGDEESEKTSISDSSDVKVSKKKGSTKKRSGSTKKQDRKSI